MASEKAKALAAKQKAEIKAEKLRKKNSSDPNDWSRTRQFVEAYKRTAEIDKLLNPLMAGAALGTIAVITAFGLLSRTAWWAWVPLALVSGLLAAMLILTNRAKRAMFERHHGQPGSAELALQMLNKKKFSYAMAVTATRQLDLVHRVIGPSGIILVGEGQPARVKPLLAAEAKRHEQVAFGVKVSTIVLGDGAGQVKLKELQKHIEKMPKAMQPYQIAELNNRLKALDAVRPKAPLPKGPMPTIKGVNRALRGR
jgi:hypothetical protein